MLWTVKLQVEDVVFVGCQISEHKEKLMNTLLSSYCKSYRHMQGSLRDVIRVPQGAVDSMKLYT